MGGWEERDPGTTGALAEGTKGQGGTAGDEGAQKHREASGKKNGRCSSFPEATTAPAALAEPRQAPTDAPGRGGGSSSDGAGGSVFARQAAPLLRAGPAAAQRRWDPAPRRSRAARSSPHRPPCSVAGTEHPPGVSGEERMDLSWSGARGGGQDPPCKGVDKNLSDDANGSSAEDGYVS